MANPLQEQLLKAGLINANQVKKAQQEKRQHAKGGHAPDKALAQAQQLALAKEKAESDRQRNRQQEEARERKAQSAQIRQMIETQRLDRSGGELPYQFVDRGKVKRIHVRADQRDQLVKGLLSVARFGNTYELVTLSTAEKIAQRDPMFVITAKAQPESESAGSAELDDPYADHPVPDDLLW